MERSNQFVGQSLPFLDAVERASRAAPLNRPVLVIGERGTGKELIASVDPVGDYTKTLGRKRSFFDELFGNIGTISQPGLPGGSPQQ